MPDKIPFSFSISVDRGYYASVDIGGLPVRLIGLAGSIEAGHRAIIEFVVAEEIDGRQLKYDNGGSVIKTHRPLPCVASVNESAISQFIFDGQNQRLVVITDNNKRKSAKVDLLQVTYEIGILLAQPMVPMAVQRFLLKNLITIDVVRIPDVSAN